MYMSVNWSDISFPKVDEAGNTTNYFKDRHYLRLVFTDLDVKPEEGVTKTLLEVRSGVGNAITLALNITATDFADTAITPVVVRSVECLESAI
ncbi:hypothetical protein Gpo141_00007065 [Globisporangium polare]